MSVSSPPNLGVIIANTRARKIVYGSYVIALVLAGASQVGYAAVQITQPDWLTAALAILTYLGIPVGGLALANAPTTSKPFGDGEGVFK